MSDEANLLADDGDASETTNDDSGSASDPSKTWTKYFEDKHSRPYNLVSGGGVIREGTKKTAYGSHHAWSAHLIEAVEPLIGDVDEDGQNLRQPIFGVDNTPTIVERLAEATVEAVVEGDGDSLRSMADNLEGARADDEDE